MGWNTAGVRILLSLERILSDIRGRSVCKRAIWLAEEDFPKEKTFHGIPGACQRDEGLSPTGTAFGIGGASYFQDWDLRKRFLRTGEWAGFTVSSKRSRHYLLSDYVPVGEAITLAMRTAVPWY